MIVLKYPLYWRLISSTSLIPAAVLYLPSWLLFKTGGMMWSGLKAAFAHRCIEGDVGLFLLYLFSVSRGVLSISSERDKT